MAAEEHRDSIATFVEIAVLVSLGAMIARALPPPLELDPKDAKETTRVLSEEKEEELCFGRRERKKAR